MDWGRTTCLQLHLVGLVVSKVSASEKIYNQVSLLKALPPFSTRTTLYIIYPRILLLTLAAVVK
jgi:hypothetical protein